jgi:hypothetical protein
MKRRVPRIRRKKPIKKIIHNWLHELKSTYMRACESSIGVASVVIRPTYSLDSNNLPGGYDLMGTY